MSYEAYSVAVKLSLINNVSSGLLLISKNIQSVHGDVDKLNEKLKSIGKTMAIGGALFGGGMALASVFKGPLEEAKKFQTAMANFSLYGMSDKVNAEAQRYVQSMNAIGTSTVENMKIFTEAQGVFRESGRSDFSALEGAKIAAPVLAKIDYASRALSEESQAKLNHGKMAMLRYIEDSGGLKSAKRFNELADAGWKMVQTSGGSVDWENLRQFKARAGVAAMNMTDDAVAEMEPLLTMLKGQTAGFSLRTAYNRLNGIIKIPNQVAHNLVDNHIWDESKIIWNKQGGIKMFKGNPLINAELFSKNPTEFYEKIIMPMYAKSGIKTDASVAQMNAMIFGSTGGAMFTLMHKNMEKLHHSLEAQHKAKGIDASVEVANGTLAGQEEQLKAKWADLKLQIGQIVLPYAIEFLKGLTSAIKDMTIWAKNNQGTVKLLTYAFMGLSAVLMGAGLILMIKGVASAFMLVGTSVFGLPAKLLAARAATLAMGSSLATATTSLGVFGAAIKWLGGVAASFAAGYGIGTGMRELYMQTETGQKFDNWLGETIAKRLAAVGYGPAAEAVAANEKYKKSSAAPVATQHSKPSSKPIVINMNGKAVAEGLIPYYIKSASKPPASIGINTSMTMPFPSF